MGKREDKGVQREMGGGLKRKKSKENHGTGLKLSNTDLLFYPFFNHWFCSEWNTSLLHSAYCAVWTMLNSMQCDTLMLQLKNKY